MQSEGSAPHFIPPPLITNFLLFLSGSGESENVRIPLAECGSEQPEFVARNMATQNQHHINIGEESPLVKVLKVLRKLFQKFPK